MGRGHYLATAALLLGLSAAAAQQTAEWTVLVYLNGDTSPGLTSLEDASISDFNELEAVGSTSNVHFVVQWDRSAADDVLQGLYPDEASQNWTTTRRYYVTQDPNQVGLDPNTMAANAAGTRITSPVLIDLGETDMGQEDTLVEFCEWTFAKFPARHYLLVLNDTGMGWQPRQRGRGRGLIFDASTTGNAADTDPRVYLTNTEVRSALTRIKALRGGVNLDAVLFDAGGMGMVETLYQCRGLVDYAVASFLDRPLDGLPYDLLATRLLAQPPTTPIALETLLVNLANDYLAGYQTGSTLLGGATSTTIGVYRMSLIEPVVTAVNALATALLADLPTYSPGLLRALARVQRGRATDYTGNYVDLQDFADQLRLEITDLPIQTAAAAIGPARLALLANTNLASTVNFNVDRCQGLGIYFPADAANYDVNYQTTTDFVSTTQWDEMVQGLLTLNSDQNGPVITIISPLPGANIIENPPTIVATIVEQDVGGRLNPDSVSLVVDGATIARDAFDFNETTGTLTYTPPAALGVTSHTFVVSARDLSGNLSSATGNFRITVPTLAAGIRTFSLPRYLTAAESDPGIVFGRGNFSLARWVPSLFGTNKYRVYPDNYATFIPTDAALGLVRPTVPAPPAGLGYWVRLVSARPLSALPGQAVVANQYQIQLADNPDGGAGWNMIANPFDVASISLASMFVLQSDGRQITFRQAIDQGLTPGVLFSYVPNTTNPNAAGRYEFHDPGVGQLIRLEGHWLKVNTDLTLVLSSGSGRAAPAPVQRSEPAGGWRLQLRVDVGDAGWDQVTVGASSETRDEYDPRWDVAAPPALPGGVEIRSLQTGWGVESGRYMRDLRGVGAEQAWDLEVAAPAGAVTVNWPNLRNLPADVQLTLTDPTNGAVKRLRTSAGYSFDHAGGARLLRLTAHRAAGGGLHLGAVTVTPGRGAGYSVGYSLSRQADVLLVVRGLAGRVLAQVAQPAAPAGRGAVYWDGLGADGRPLPNGIYRLEVLATSPDGATTRELRTVRVVR